VVLATGNPLGVLDLVSGEFKRRFYFLDFDLKGDVTGLQLGIEIRKQDIDGFIVYFTKHPELMYLNFTHRIRAIDFIIKSDSDQVRKSIRKIMQDVNEIYLNAPKETQRLYIKEKGVTQFINYDDVVLVETDNTNRKLVIVTDKSERISFSGSLKDIEKLDGRFFYYNRSIVLNLNHIIKIEKSEESCERHILMSTGDKLVGTRASLKRLRECSDRQFLQCVYG